MPDQPVRTSDEDLRTLSHIQDPFIVGQLARELLADRARHAELEAALNRVTQLAERWEAFLDDAAAAEVVDRVAQRLLQVTPVTQENARATASLVLRELGHIAEEEKRDA